MRSEMLRDTGPDEAGQMVCLSSLLLRQANRPCAFRCAAKRPFLGHATGMRRTQPGWIKSGFFTGGELALTISVCFAPCPLP